jgi:hypothetical protein
MNTKGASIGWNVTRESFMSNVTWLNNLKLRASMELNSTSGTTNYGAQNLFGTTPMEEILVLFSPVIELEIII